MSRTYQARPSEVLGLPSDDLSAYCLDRAVMFFGTSLEADLDKAVAQGKRKKPLSDHEKNSKRQTVLNNWLGDAAPDRRFRDPMTARKG